jgi:hypothetical protein
LKTLNPPGHRRACGAPSRFFQGVGLKGCKGLETLNPPGHRRACGAPSRAHELSCRARAEGLAPTLGLSNPRARSQRPELPDLKTGIYQPEGLVFDRVQTQRSIEPKVVGRLLRPTP